MINVPVRRERGVSGIESRPARGETPHTPETVWRVYPYLSLIYAQAWYGLVWVQFGSLGWHRVSVLMSTKGLGFWCLALRRLPVILPHELLPWLLRQNAFAEVHGSDLATYWGHFRDKVPWGHAADGLEERIHPLYLWGDDAVFNEGSEKLLVIAMGHQLDIRKNSLESVWPLCCVRDAS